jgi:hypothetical protein
MNRTMPHETDKIGTTLRALWKLKRRRPEKRPLAAPRSIVAQFAAPHQGRHRR